MQSGTGKKDIINEALLAQPARLFYDSISLELASGEPNCVFYLYPERRDKAVAFFLFLAQFSSFGFFLWLADIYPFGSKALIALPEAIGVKLRD